MLEACLFRSEKSVKINVFEIVLVEWVRIKLGNFSAHIFLFYFFFAYTLVIVWRDTRSFIARIKTTYFLILRNIQQF